MGKRVWYELEVRTSKEDGWNVTLKVKSPGLANKAMVMLREVYRQDYVRFVHNKSHNFL